jgi:hypothetical protein
MPDYRDDEKAQLVNPHGAMVPAEKPSVTVGGYAPTAYHAGGSATGPEKFVVHKPGLYKVSAVPDYHPDRLKWETRGGKQYPITDWLPDEFISLSGPGIDVPARLQGKPAPHNPAGTFVDLGGFADLRLQLGEYVLQPSPGFVGTYSFSAWRLSP